MVPSAENAGRSAARDSSDVSGRMPSSVATTTGAPRRCGTSTGHDLLGEHAGLHAAAAARRWLSTATRSCASRAIESALLPRSVDEPIDSRSNASVSPSNARESTAWMSP